MDTYSEEDVVNSPSHYLNDKFDFETIDVIEAYTAGLDGIEAVCAGNVLKYICRWNKKNGVEDLCKAAWYLDRLINHILDNEQEIGNGSQSDDEERAIEAQGDRARRNAHRRSRP